MSLKIVEQTPSRLELHESRLLEETPYEKGTWFGLIGCLLPFLLLFGGIPSLFGLFSIYESLFHGIPVTLNCQRINPTQISCKLKNLGLLTSKDREFNNLNGIKIDKTYNTDSESNVTTIYTIVLLTSSGDFPLKPYSSPSYEALQAAHLRIKTFIEHPKETSLTIQIQETQPYLALLNGVGLITFFGLPSTFFFIRIIIYLSSTSTCTFDKNIGRVSLERKDLLGAKVVNYLLDEISDIQVEEKTYSSEDGKYKVYRLVLVLASSKHLPLTSFRRNYSSESYQLIVDCIRRFLNLERTI